MSSQRIGLSSISLWSKSCVIVAKRVVGKSTQFYTHSTLISCCCTLLKEVHYFHIPVNTGNATYRISRLVWLRKTWLPMVAMAFLRRDLTVSKCYDPVASKKNGSEKLGCTKLLKFVQNFKMHRARKCSRVDYGDGIFRQIPVIESKTEQQSSVLVRIQTYSVDNLRKETGLPLSTLSSTG